MTQLMHFCQRTVPSQTNVSQRKVRTVVTRWSNIIVKKPFDVFSKIRHSTKCIIYFRWSQLIVSLSEYNI